MTRTYDGLFILNTSGKEESAKELIEKIEKDIQLAGGKTLKINRMDKRPFARIAQRLDSGYYVNIVFDIAPEKLLALQNKFKLDDDIFRVMFLRSNLTPIQPERKSESRETVHTAA